MDDQFEPTVIEEQLSCGGTLCLHVTSWSIRYYFPGPDRRYNGTFGYLRPDKIETTASALRKNFAEYKRMKASSSSATQLSRQVAEGMTIRIGGPAEGVCLKDNHMPLTEEHQIESLISSWLFARERESELRRKISRPLSHGDDAAPTAPPERHQDEALGDWVLRLAVHVVTHFPFHDNSAALRELRKQVKQARGGLNENDPVWQHVGPGTILRARDLC